MSDPSQYSAALSAYSFLPFNSTQANLMPLPSTRAYSFSALDPNVNLSVASTLPHGLTESTAVDQLLPSLAHGPSLRQTSDTPLQPLGASDLPAMTAINCASSSSWSSDSSSTGTDEWLPALPTIQTPGISTSSSESTSVEASSSPLPPISFSSSLLGHAPNAQSAESNFYASASTSAAVSLHSTAPSTAAPRSAGRNASASASFASESAAPVPSPLSFPSTSTSSTNSSSSHSPSPISPSASFEEVASASRAKSRRQMNWRARLESQKRYDRKRRSTIRVLFESLRKILKNTQTITQEVEQKIEAEPQSELSPAASGDSSAMECVDGKDEQGSTAKKKSKKRPKERTFDDFSTIDLVNEASKAIRNLNEMKEKLEKQISDLKSEDAMLEGEIDPNETDREYYYCKKEELEDWERRHRYTHLIDAEDADTENDKEQAPGNQLVLASDPSSRLVSSPGLQFSKAFRSSSSGVHLNELQSLLHAIHHLNRHYTAELEAVRELENQLPKEVSDLANYFGGSFGILGMDGRVAMVLKVNEAHPHKKDFDRYFSNQYHAAHQRFRAPHIVQMHALAYVMRSGFCYQSDDASADVATSVRGEEQTDPRAPNITRLFPHPHEEEPEAPERKDKFTSAEVMEFLSAGMRRSSVNGTNNDVDLRSHPLGCYALPPESFRILLEALGYLASLSESEYDRQWSQLSAIAAEIFPFPLLGWKMPTQSVKQMVFNPIAKVTHTELSGFYELYAGLKPIITMKKRKMFMNGELRYIDWDIVLIKHPKSGLPLAHLTIPRGIYTDPELQALEERLYRNCPPELSLVMQVHKEQRRQQQNRADAVHAAVQR